MRLLIYKRTLWSNKGYTEDLLRGVSALRSKVTFMVFIAYLVEHGSFCIHHKRPIAAKMKVLEVDKLSYVVICECLRGSKCQECQKPKGNL